MKRIIFALLLGLSFAGQASAQAIYTEVKKIMDDYQVVKDDTSKSLDVRKIATFKWDAIYYLVYKSADDTESELGEQVSAMIDFVNLFISKIDNAKGTKNRQVIMAKFKNATIENARYNDPDKEIIYAYVDNQDFLTQFSLDTDWVKALEEVKK